MPNAAPPKRTTISLKLIAKIRNPQPIRYHPKELRAKAIELFRQNVGYCRVARRLGVPSGTVRDWKRQFDKGRFEEEVPRSLVPYDDAVKRKAVSMRLKGATWRRIKDATGASPASVLRWMNALDDLKAGISGQDEKLNS